MSKKQIYLEKKDNMHSTIRKIGREPGMKEDAKENVVTFLSVKNGLTLFIDEENLIKFNKSVYITDNKKDIDYLRKHPAYKKSFFEGKYPEYVIKKMKDDQKYIELVEDAFELAEA